MKNNSFKKHVFEGVMIIFSVLFALYINKLYDNHRTNQKKDLAIESIRKELAQNIITINEWNNNHSRVNNRLFSLIEGKGDSLKKVLLEENYFNFGLLLNNKNLINSNLSNTAWETTKSTGIISEFDFETIQNLTNAYSLQEVITSKSLQNILDFYFNMEAHNMENLDAILIQFHLRFKDLVGQEYAVQALYRKALDEL